MLAKKYEQAKKTGTLDLSDMKLKVLPPLPDSIVRLDCSKNQLTCLPALPESLTGLNCYMNQLVCLPDLPDALHCTVRKIC